MGNLAIAVGACACLCAFGCAVDGNETGKRVYDASCVACHSTGAAGAPKLGDEESWGQRAEQGFARLVDAAINGKGGMPPKGGNATLENHEISQAVAYILMQTGISAN